MVTIGLSLRFQFSKRKIVRQPLRYAIPSKMALTFSCSFLHISSYGVSNIFYNSKISKWSLWTISFSLKHISHLTIYARYVQTPTLCRGHFLFIYVPRTLINPFLRPALIMCKYIYENTYIFYTYILMYSFSIITNGTLCPDYTFCFRVEKHDKNHPMYVVT